MEESSHRLGMTVLEIRDTVKGYESLDEEVIQRLMNAEGFCPLTPDLQMRVLGQLVRSPSWLVAEVGGTAILVTNQWIVSIHGDSLAHCVVTLMKYRNAIANELETSVTGEIQTPFAENTGPLQEVVRRRERQGRDRDKLSKVGWMLGGAVAGTMLTIIVNVLTGG